MCGRKFFWVRFWIGGLLIVREGERSGWAVGIGVGVEEGFLFFFRAWRMGYAVYRWLYGSGITLYMENKCSLTADDFLIVV